MSSVCNFCRWDADVPPRKTSQRCRVRRNRCFLQTKYVYKFQYTCSVVAKCSLLIRKPMCHPNSKKTYKKCSKIWQHVSSICHDSQTTSQQATCMKHNKKNQQASNGTLKYLYDPLISTFISLSAVHNMNFISYISIHVISTVGFKTNSTWPALQLAWLAQWRGRVVSIRFQSLRLIILLRKSYPLS